jgi:hypothetical protein
MLLVPAPDVERDVLGRKACHCLQEPPARGAAAGLLNAHACSSGASRRDGDQRSLT